jgi:hypothetical protein
VLLFILAALMMPAAAVGQTSVAASDTVRVVAGARYAGGGLHRALLGDGWRDLWIAEIRVPVVDLERTGGGLRPVARGGGFQTRSLEMESGDGRAFRFRSVDKDPSQTLPLWFRLPGLVQMIRDQTSALFPAGALVAAELAEVAGIPHPIPHLVVMPDDARLGEFRREFGGMLGILEERHSPQSVEPARDGFQRVVGTDTLYTLLAASDGAAAVDQRQYLAARLLDLYLNDWDRHGGNWLWGTRDAGPPQRWIAIPKDRDQALANYGGAIVALVRRFIPKLLPLTTEYHLEGLTVNSSALDDRFLRGLPPEVWDSAAVALRTRLTDGAIEQALRAMPQPYYQRSRDQLLMLLRARRTGLPAAARAWARSLANAGGGV